MLNAKTNLTVPIVLVGLGMIWGSAFILMKVLVDEISPAQIVAARLSLGALVVTTVAVFRGRLGTLTPSVIGPAALLVLVDNVIPNTLVAWSETRIDSGMASVLMSAMPLFTTIFAMTLLREGVSGVRVAGLVIGFCGVMIVSDGDVLSFQSNNGIGMLAVVGASSSHAVAAIYTKKLLARFDPLRLTAMKLTAGAAMTSPIVLATQGTGAYAAMSLEAVICLLLLGIMATGVAYAAYVWVVGAAGVVQASLVTYIIPVAGLVLAWAVLGEPMGVSTIAGGAVMVAGIVTVMFGPLVRIPRLPLRAPTAEQQEASA